MEGDNYYTSCVQTLKDAGKFVNAMLLVEELQRTFLIEDKEISFDIDDCLVNGITSIKDEPNCKNLLQVSLLFNRHHFGFGPIWI